jgi:O-antigen/teichoic acid export membrane protein
VRDSGSRLGSRVSVLRNALSAYGNQALLALTVIAITPILYRKLGAAGFGTWSVILTFASVFTLVEIGFGRGISKLTAEHLAADRRKDLDETVGVGATTLGAVGVVCAATAAAVGFLASGLAPSSLTHEFTVGMVVLAVERLVYFPLGSYYAALQGYQRFDLRNLIGSINTVVFSAGALLAVLAGGGVVWLAVAFAVAHILQGVLALVFLRRVDPTLSLRPRVGARADRRRLVSLSSYVMFAESMTFISQRMDTVVIASVRNAAAAGPYAALLKLQTGLQSLTLPVIYQLMPMASGLWARDDRRELEKRLVLATRATLQVTLPVAAVFALFAGDIVDLWLGKGAADSATSILVVLMLAQIFVLLGAPAEQVLIGIGRVRTIGLLSVVEGPLNLALSIVLVKAYGAVGACLGTLATSGVIAPLKLPLAGRALGVSSRKLFVTSVVPAVASSLPTLGVIVAIRLLVGPGEGRFFLGAAAGLTLAAAVAVAQIGPQRLLALLRVGSPREPQTAIEA